MVDVWDKEREERGERGERERTHKSTKNGEATSNKLCPAVERWAEWRQKHRETRGDESNPLCQPAANNHPENATRKMPPTNPISHRPSCTSGRKVRAFLLGEEKRERDPKWAPFLINDRKPSFALAVAYCRGFVGLLAPSDKSKNIIAPSHLHFSLFFFVLLRVIFCSKQNQVARQYDIRASWPARDVHNASRRFGGIETCDIATATICPLSPVVIYKIRGP